MSETTGREALAEVLARSLHAQRCTLNLPCSYGADDLEEAAPLADAAIAHIAAVLSDEATWRDLTHAIMAHYGYTPDDVAYAEGIHPERICDDECPDHGGVWRELGQTAAVLIDVAQPFFAERFGIEADR